MNLDLRDVPTLLLPGTGSDDNYALRAFAPALTDAGAIPVKSAFFASNARPIPSFVSVLARRSPSPASILLPSAA